MEITIGKKTYPLIFGLRFIRELDKRFTIQSNGLQLGFGIATAVTYIQQRNPVVLVDLIQAATVTERSKPSVLEIEEYIEAETTDLEKLFKDFLSEFEKSHVIKGTMKNLEAISREAETA